MTHPALWQKGPDRLLLKTAIFDLHGQTYTHPQRGRSREFVVIDAPDWVNVVALTPDHQLILVNQFRYGSGSLSWEVPGGVIERNEDPVAAGLRELQEETGCRGTQARLLGSIQPNPAIMNNRCHIVLVEDARQTGQTQWDADEELALKKLPPDEAFAQARNGGILHSLTLCALFMFEPLWKARRDASAPDI